MNDPLRFIGYMFEIAIWPFQAASRYAAKESPYCDQQLVLVFLYPAMILLPLLCLMISIVAMAYVFFALPVLFLCRRITGLFLPRLNRIVRS